MYDHFVGFFSNPIIGFIGTALTVIGIIVAIILFYKQQKYPRKFSFYSFKTVNLYNNLSLPFSDVQIKYSGKEIKSNILYISGFIICDGHRDITGENNSIVFRLPDHYKWLDIDISSINENLHDLDNTIKENIATIFFDMFKCNESFFVQFLVETPYRNIESQKEILSIENRIVDTEEIVKIKELSPYVKERRQHHRRYSVFKHFLNTFILPIFMFISGFFALYNKDAFEIFLGILLIIIGICYIIYFIVNFKNESRLRIIFQKYLERFYYNRDGYEVRNAW